MNTSNTIYYAKFTILIGFSGLLNLVLNSCILFNSLTVKWIFFSFRTVITSTFRFNSTAIKSFKNFLYLGFNFLCRQRNKAINFNYHKFVFKSFLQFSVQIEQYKMLALLTQINKVSATSWWNNKICTRIFVFMTGHYHHRAFIFIFGVKRSFCVCARQLQFGLALKILRDISANKSEPII